jgi:hypothetical protein
VIHENSWIEIELRGLLTAFRERRWGLSVCFVISMTFQSSGCRSTQAGIEHCLAKEAILAASYY